MYAYMYVYMNVPMHEWMYVCADKYIFYGFTLPILSNYCQFQRCTYTAYFHITVPMLFHTKFKMKVIKNSPFYPNDNISFANAFCIFMFISYQILNI